ncbi:helix-turn-helix domain-containing protein [Synechococcus sp. CBW1006]|uniref:helix-turn-helix domain-containing protein n=1 Tax=Synechococcus sp. CBW1006 TaxID=1353138 RepID=UPI0018CF2208|nr:helix-turn-helix domain-containing protein [Synechococcus sp. CBW1006]QPN66320.1 helix-turn-helix domain-containing protein [Synechococcus sp. CBW1006]
MSPDVLAAVPLPLSALGVEIESDACTYAEQSSTAMGERLIVPLVQDRLFLAQFSLVDLAGLVIHSGRISPLISRQELSDVATLVASFSGTYFYRHGSTHRDTEAGDVLLTQNDGGVYHCNYCSGICLNINNALLQQTVENLLDHSCTQTIPALLELKKADSGALFGFFAHVNQLLEQERWLPKALGLGSQLYRYLAVALLQQSGHIDRLRQRQQGRRRWSPGVDELVDYIRSNRAVPLPMADLERLSHFLARHLTTLFRERFNCTPMQFVRRQRLEMAMERLTAPQPGDTVIRIARECV